MSRFSLLTLTVILLIFALSSVSCQNTQCSDSLECKTKYCRYGECVEYGGTSDESGTNPCWTVRCKGGHVCTLRQVQCIRAPCPPIPECTECSGAECEF